MIFFIFVRRRKNRTEERERERDPQQNGSLSAFLFCVFGFLSVCEYNISLALFLAEWDT